MKKLILVFLLFHIQSMAQESRDYAVMAKKMWAAFECSALAATYEDFDERDRLFLYGYALGQEFMDAIEDEKIEKQDMYEIVPTILMFILDGPGPTREFQLGQIYETATDLALSDVRPPPGEHRTWDEMASLAQSGYDEGNCALIGE